ncbi:MAG: protein phosphatase 2C domain-containing protein [Pseudomonadota bacterium]
MPVEAAGATNIGQREHNEDAYLIDLERGLALVADGVGGHQAGEVASAITCESLAESTASGHSLHEGIRRANAAILAAVEEGEGNEGMATTAVALSIGEDGFEIAWVGDSRCYLLDGNSLKLLTRDHSLVENLLKRGEITLEEAREHPKRNVIVQAIGLQEGELLRIDRNVGTLLPGQVLMLCSDGVSDVLDNAALFDILSAGGDLQRCCNLLVQSAVDAGGRDNATAILVRGSAGGEASPDAEVVWSYDAGTGEITGLREVAPVAAIASDDDKPPKTTQMMEAAALERQVQRERGAKITGGRRMMSLSVIVGVLMVALVVAFLLLL